ncbi:hypothetical protein COO60DRAFT_451367 [Scenedesmus sp. NREL 46B-D3]|nr:hypothetical protein COO60DRAFT_451367 [Scenedesmus sp. NREL 46B-D3]
MASLGQVNKYYEELSNAISTGQASRVKPLLRLDHPTAQQALFGSTSVSTAQLQGAAKRWLQQPWASIAAQHLLALSKRSSGRPDLAFVLYTAAEGPAKGALNALAENPQDLWVAAAMEQTASNTVVLASQADAQLMLTGDSSKSKAVGGFLQLCISALGPARRPEEAARRRGNLTLLILLTRVYMRLNNVQGCSQVLKNFKQNYSGEVLQRVPAAYRVCAYYYLGRTELNSDNIAGGIDMLQAAFRECKADSENVKHILRALVPLKMLHGELPTVQLLQRHALQEYEPFREAIAVGDVGLFDRSMQMNQYRLIANGTYLLLEKLRFSVFRRLVKRCVGIARQHAARDWAEHHLPLGLVLGVLQQQQVATDMDEVECTLSNCIVRRYIKGYISNKQKVLVLAKDDPFPGACEEWWKEPHFVGSA